MHTKPYKWTPEALAAEARKFNTRPSFRVGSPSAYVLAERRKVLKTITGHMLVQRKTWAFDEVLSVAKNYETKKAFRAGNLPAHEFARRHGWFDEVTAHMVPPGTGEGWFAIYQLTFPKGETYIGLSCSLDVRMRKHLKVGTVAKYLTAKGYGKPTLELLHQNLGSVEASRLEVEEIARARLTHQSLLNRHKGGGLGAFGRRSMSKERVFARALNYQTRTEFRENDRASHSLACRKGWIDEACAHMHGRGLWASEEELAAIAATYRNRTAFRQGSFPAYRLATYFGILDEICQHMPTFQPPIPITMEEVVERAKLYQTRTAFQQGDNRTYHAARRFGVIDAVCSHMPVRSRRKSA